DGADSSPVREAGLGRNETVGQGLVRLGVTGPRRPLVAEAALMEELAGRSVLVLGLGISGRSAAAFCAERGARVVAADERSADALADAVPPGVEPWLGRSFPDPADFDVVVPSPGVPPERYRSRAARVCGDIELAAGALSVPIVAVTGTNGKSTTTSLV